MILITGASGTVGHEVLKQALALGLNIRATFQSSAVASKAPAGLEGVIMDYNKPETIRTALRGVEKIFLVGPSVRDLPALEANFIKEVRATGRQHIVKLSALGGRESMFPSGHRDSEDMQNLVNYNAGTIRTQNAFYGSQGKGAVSLVDIRDIAAVTVIVLAATGHEGKSYSLTGGEALTNEQVAEKISRVARREITYKDLPPVEFKKALVSSGTQEWSVDALVDLQLLYREGKASLLTDDVERLTGRKPKTFDQFARDYAFAFQDEAKVAS